jgi:hypothetical protein
MPEYGRDQSKAELQRLNAELIRELHVTRDKLLKETQRADLAQKSASDAWRFAKVALRTSRPRSDA